MNESTPTSIAVLTVVRNDLVGLRKTLSTIGSQSCPGVRHIIVDGASTDGTQEFLQAEAKVAIVVSEPDHGIYDAMNKALALADAEWVIFMNAGDRFASERSLEAAMQLTGDDVDAVYSDVLFNRGGWTEHVECDHASMRLHHQAIVYRKALHERHGPYLVAPGVTISDYLFFQQTTGVRWRKSEEPIALCDTTGVTSKPAAYYQKLAVDLIFARKPTWLVGAMLLLHPCYRLLARPLVRVCQRLSHVARGRDEP